MFPLITWKVQAICLQKLQAVVISLSLLNFLEEYLIVKRFFSRGIHKMCSHKEVPGYIRSRAPLWTQKQHIFGQ